MSGHYREGGLSSGVAFKRGSTVNNTHLLETTLDMTVDILSLSPLKLSFNP